MNTLLGISSLTTTDAPQNEAQLTEVAREFESLFIQTLLKTAHSQHNAFQSEWSNSDATQSYQEWMDAQWAEQLAQREVFGIAKAVREQLAVKGTQNG